MALPATDVTPFTGFAPDLDPQTPGIWLTCDKVYPTLKGFRPTQGPVQLFPALPSRVLGAYRARFRDNSERLYAGTATKLYGSAALTWSDLSSGAYTLTAPNRWRFAQFGDDVITTNGADNVQVAAGGASSFADLGGTPPKAKIAVAVNNFVFLLNITSPIPASNQWWCSGIGSDAVWTPDIATQSANGLLTETYGEITAAHPLGPDLVIYKLRSMYLAQYLGPPVIWGFQLLSKETGAPGQEAVVEMADMHVFPGYDDFYTYNGGRPQPLQSPVREFFFQTDLDQNYQQLIIGRWDKLNGVVVWHYPSTSASPEGTLDKWIAWHPYTNHWTMGTRTVEYVLQSDLPVTTGVIYDDVGLTIITYDSGSPKTYDGLFPDITPVGYPAIFLTDHILYTLNGLREASTFTTGDVGSDLRFSYHTKVKPKFSIYPTFPVGTATYGDVGYCYTNYRSAGGFTGQNGTTYVNTYGNFNACLVPPTLTEYYKLNLGDTLSTGQTARLNGQGWFHVRRRSRFHRYKFSFPADMEIIGYELPLTDSGAR